jgi:actin-related protein
MKKTDEKLIRERQELIKKLEELRQKGVKVAPSKEISDKWAERDAQKRRAELLKKEKEEREEEALNLYRAFFPDLFDEKGEPIEKDEKKFKEQLAQQDFNRALWKTRNDVKEFREAAVRQGETHQALPDDLLNRVTYAFIVFNPERYRDVLWSLVTECLKVQDREAKKQAFDVANKWLSRGHFDFGWIMSMLRYPYPDEVEKDDVNMYYVSRYGWDLLRKHAKMIAPIGHTVLREAFDYWAKRPETWEKWERLAKEAKDGCPVDMRELYAMYAK